MGWGGYRLGTFIWKPSSKMKKKKKKEEEEEEEEEQNVSAKFDLAREETWLVDFL
jgi:hypothetical protein